MCQELVRASEVALALVATEPCLVLVWDGAIKLSPTQLTHGRYLWQGKTNNRFRNRDHQPLLMNHLRIKYQSSQRQTCQLVSWVTVPEEHSGTEAFQATCIANIAYHQVAAQGCGARNILLAEVPGSVALRMLLCRRR